MSSTDPHTLVGPYVLDALPPDERDLFESHLERCADCRAEAAELLAAAAHLGQAAAVVPAPELRDQVLADVAVTRQVAPSPVRALTPQRRPWITALAAAAIIAVVAALGALVVESDHRADRAEELAAVISSPDAETVVVSGDGGTMELVVSAEQDSAVVVANGMAAPPDGKTYALWYDTDGVMVFHGTFEPDADGVVRQPVEGVPDGVVGVTVEDAGTAPAEPNLPPVAVGTI